MGPGLYISCLKDIVTARSVWIEAQGLPARPHFEPALVSNAIMPRVNLLLHPNARNANILQPQLLQTPNSEEPVAVSFSIERCSGDK